MGAVAHKPAGSECRSPSTQLPLTGSTPGEEGGTSSQQQCSPSDEKSPVVLGYSFQLRSKIPEARVPHNVKLVEKMGAGSFGFVYKAELTGKSGTPYGDAAVKLGRALNTSKEFAKDSTYASMANEISRYHALTEAAYHQKARSDAGAQDASAAAGSSTGQSIPSFVAGGLVNLPKIKSGDPHKADPHQFIVMQLLGSNLFDYMCKERNECPGGRMPPKVWVRLGRAMLAALQSFHALGWVHRDVKLDNFCLNPEQGAKPEVFIMDFGFATLPAQHEKDKLEFSGTVDFSSDRTLHHLKPGRVDDLISLNYSLLEAWMGHLPWSKSEMLKREEYPQFVEHRRAIWNDMVASGKIPRWCLEWDDYCRELSVTSMPDYSYLRDLIELEDPDCRMKHALAAASTMMMQQPQGCSGLTLGASKPNAAPCMPAESGEPSVMDGGMEYGGDDSCDEQESQPAAKRQCRMPSHHAHDYGLPEPFAPAACHRHQVVAVHIPQQQLQQPPDWGHHASPVLPTVHDVGRKPMQQDAIDQAAASPWSDNAALQQPRIDQQPQSAQRVRLPPLDLSACTPGAMQLGDQPKPDLDHHQQQQRAAGPVMYITPAGSYPTAEEALQAYPYMQPVRLSQGSQFRAAAPYLDLVVLPHGDSALLPSSTAHQAGASMGGPCGLTPHRQVAAAPSPCIDSSWTSMPPPSMPPPSAIPRPVFMPAAPTAVPVMQAAHHAELQYNMPPYIMPPPHATHPDAPHAARPMAPACPAGAPQVTPPSAYRAQVCDFDLESVGEWDCTTACGSVEAGTAVTGACLTEEEGQAAESFFLGY